MSNSIPDGEPQMFGRDWHMGERVAYRGFTCARCGAACATTSTEAEANRELVQNFPNGAVMGDTDELVSVCDDCYDYVMTRARSDGLV